MADIVEQIIGGFFSGVAAGIIGYAVDAVTMALFEAFRPFNPMFAVFGIIYPIISFLSGISEAEAAGICFSLGIIVAGYFLHDLVTFIIGVIATLAWVDSVASKRNSRLY